MREQVSLGIGRLRIGRAAESVLVVGLRGVGKTVLLDKMRSDAEADGIFTVRVETPEDQSPPAPQLRLALLRLSRVERAKDMANQSLHALAGFIKGLKLKYSDTEVGLDLAAVAGLADNGELEGGAWREFLSRSFRPVDPRRKRSIFARCRNWASRSTASLPFVRA